jgi:hypothetical protein
MPSKVRILLCPPSQKPGPACPDLAFVICEAKVRTQFDSQRGGEVGQRSERRRGQSFSAPWIFGFQSPPFRIGNRHRQFDSQRSEEVGQRRERSERRRGQYFPRKASIPGGIWIASLTDVGRSMGCTKKVNSTFPSVPSLFRSRGEKFDQPH